MLSFLILFFLTAGPFLVLGIYALIDDYENYKFRKNVSIAAMSKTYNIGV
jgi:hypothetical protein